MIGRIIKEPFLHFFLLGAAIFALYGILGDSDELGSDEILVTTGHIERLVTGWKKTRMRPPTQTELQGLIDELIREEIYYREALAMGLDGDDSIIRRRLRQKMEFLSHDLAAQVDPTEAELLEYLQSNAEKFRVEPVMSFRQVFLSRDQRGESVDEDALDVLEQLQSNVLIDLESVGDSLMLPQSVQSLTAFDVRNMFGSEFAVQIATLQPGGWQGPVSSSYGLHLVFVDAISDSRLPELAEVHGKVETEWRNEQRTNVNNAIYLGFRERYTITVEQPEWLDDGQNLGSSGQR